MCFNVLIKTLLRPRSGTFGKRFKFACRITRRRLLTVQQVGVGGGEVELRLHVLRYVREAGGQKAREEDQAQRGVHEHGVGEHRVEVVKQLCAGDATSDDVRTHTSSKRARAWLR